VREEIYREGVRELVQDCYRVKICEALPREQFFCTGIKSLDGSVGRTERLQEPREAGLIGGNVGAPGKRTRQQCQRNGIYLDLNVTLRHIKIEMSQEMYSFIRLTVVICIQ
jgi:hypothetical protein